MKKKLKLICLLGLLFLIASCGRNYPGYYGGCYGGSKYINVYHDGTISVTTSTYGTGRGKWEKADGGIKVSGLPRHYSSYNGFWEDGPSESLIRPDGRRACKSGYSIDR